METLLHSPLTWVGAVVLAMFAILGYFAGRYEKVGPNEVLIVSGRPSSYQGADGVRVNKNFRIFHGGGTFVWPVRERVDRLSLELMTLEIKTPEFYTKFGVPIIVDGIAQIKVRSDDPVALITAAEMFLSKSRTEMNEIALQMMSGHLRSVISTLPFEEIHCSPEMFAQTVQRLTAEDLANMGIQVVSFTIREIQDPKGYLQAIGRPKMAEVQKNAVLGEATATRDSTMGKSLAEREATITSSKAVEDARLAQINADVAVAKAEKDKSIQLERFNAEVALEQAQKDLAYDLQKAKTQQALTEEAMGVSLIEKRKLIELEQSEIERRELELMHTVRKPAEAEAKKIQMLADAERERRMAMAEAEAQATRKMGLADAEVIRAKGEAEAEAIRQKALAEAEGQRAKFLAEAEGMQQKAKAWQEYNEAALSQLLIEKLPEIAGAVAQPLSKIDRITMVQNGGSSDGTGIEKVTKGVSEVLMQLPGVVETMSGLNLPEMLAKVPALSGKTAKNGAAAKPAKAVTSAKE
ncbi:MAG: flotillin family protein [Armatimonadetes bacterium]|nr:flotillin family protein [Armatimonadota bacterium]